MIPSFHSRSLLPSLIKEYEQLRPHVQRLQEEERWEIAESLLMARCDETRKSGDCAEEALRDLCELYRKAMRSKKWSHRRFGYDGISGMLTVDLEESDHIKEIRQFYCWVAAYLAKINHDPTPRGRIEREAEYKMDENLFQVGTIQDVLDLESAYPVGLVIAEKFKEQIERMKKSTGVYFLFWAASKGCKELVEDLLCMGVNINVYDETHRTALSWASENGHEAVVKVLIKAKQADIESKDMKGRTPLSWAVQSGNVGVVKLLLETGRANVEAEDDAGVTPLEYAKNGEHEEITKLLLSHLDAIRSSQTF